MNLVTCWVALQILGADGPTNLNIELHGVEVKELSSDRSLVNFGTDIAQHRLRVLGPVVMAINMNVCQYMPDTVARFNSTSSELTATERDAFLRYSRRTVGQPSHVSNFVSNIK